MSTSVSFHAEPGTCVTLFDRDGRDLPFFVLDANHERLTISTRHNLSVPEVLTFARELARTTAAYLAAVESYAASLPTPPDAPATTGGH